MLRFVPLGCVLTSLALTSHDKELSQADLATAPALVDQTVAPRYSLCDPEALAAQGLPTWRRDEHGEMIQCIPKHYSRWREPAYHWGNTGLARGTICGLTLDAPYEKVNCKATSEIGSITHTTGAFRFEANFSHGFGMAK